MIVHTADRQLFNGLVGGLIFGAGVGILIDDDLEDDLPAAIAGVTGKGLLLHVAERTFMGRVIASLNLIGSFDDTYIGGGEASKATMLALAPAGIVGSLYF